MMLLLVPSLEGLGAPAVPPGTIHWKPWFLVCRRREGPPARMGPSRLALSCLVLGVRPWSRLRAGAAPSESRGGPLSWHIAFLLSGDARGLAAKPGAWIDPGARPLDIPACICIRASRQHYARRECRVNTPTKKSVD